MNLDSFKDTAGHQRWPMQALVWSGIVLLAGLASYAAFRGDFWGEDSRLPASFQLALEHHIAIDPGQIHFTSPLQFDVPCEHPRAIAVGPFDDIYVAGEGAVHVFSREGQKKLSFDVTGEPSCLAVGNAAHVEPGRIYAGVDGVVYAFHADGQAVGSWHVPREQAMLTCIVVAENDVFVADAGNRVVWRFTPDGQLVGHIGTLATELESSEFVVSSPYFDLVIGAEDLLHIANPGKLKVAAYTFNGDFGKAWGRADSTLSGFFGCCNPSHLAMLPDGRFVTSEKGIPRVKVYDPRGEFDTVVAGPLQLNVDENAVGDPRCSDDRFIFDIATDSRGRVLVLDANHRRVLVFVEDVRSDAQGDAA